MFYSQNRLDPQKKKGIHMYDPYSNFTTFTLENGIEVHVLHVPERTVEHMNVIVHAGSLHEPVEHQGLAHLLEHVVCSTNGKPLVEFMDALSIEGAAFNASTDLQSTMYHLEFLTTTPFKSELVGLVGRMMQDTHFAPYLESERSIVLREFGNTIKERNEMRARVIHQALFRGLWMESRGSAIGSRNSVAAMPLAALERWHKEMYVPKNTSIVAVGGLSPEEVHLLLRRGGFEYVKPGERRTLFPSLKPPNPEKKYIRDDVSVEQGSEKTAGHSLIWALPLPRNMMETSAIKFLRNLVSMPLLKALREERSLVYGTDVSWGRFGSCVEFALDAHDLAPSTVNTADEVMREVISGVNASEPLFERLQHVARLQLLKRDETIEEICNAASTDISLFGRMIPLKEELAAIKRETFEKVMSLTKYVHAESALAVTIVQ